MSLFQQTSFRSDQIAGWEAVEPLTRRTDFFFKAIFNETGIAFFSKSSQHREVKTAGLSYEDDYRGNALAVVFSAGLAEIRYHRDFSDERVRGIVSRICAAPPLHSFAAAVDWRYQGRMLREKAD